MSGVNKVILIGNLGADPDLRNLPSGGSVANLSIATSETWKDKHTGEPQERTEWHRVSIFGKLAEIAGQYLEVGAKVYIEGQLRTRKWQDQSGQDRYTTEVVVQGYSGVMQMLGGRQSASTDQSSAEAYRAASGSSRASKAAIAANTAAQAPAAPSVPDFDDDIPF